MSVQVSGPQTIKSICSRACLPQCAFDRAISTRATYGAVLGSTTIGSTVAIVAGMPIRLPVPRRQALEVIPLHIVSVHEGQKAGGEGLGIGYEGGQLAVAGLLGRHAQHGGHVAAPALGARAQLPAARHVVQRAERRHERVRVRPLHGYLEHFTGEHVTCAIEST